MVLMSGHLDAVHWPIRTSRLVIRPAVPDDVDTVWQIRRLESVGRWMRSAAADPVEFRREFHDPQRLAKTLVIELDHVVIGDLMLAVEDGWAQDEAAEEARAVQAELGWCLDPRYERNGYATEAVTELVCICFEDLGLRRVTANCFADNEPSWRLMERLGMRRELHAVRESLHRSGEWLDGFGYAVLADEWPPARRGTSADRLKPYR
jgi:RimJ/RimL family protein N-acetyltransferase